MGVGYVYLHIFSRDLDKILKDNYYAYKCLYNFPLSEMNFYGEPDKEEEVMKLRESYEEYFYDSERYFITEYWHVLRFLLIVKGGLLISEGHTSLNC